MAWHPSLCITQASIKFDAEKHKEFQLEQVGFRKLFARCNTYKDPELMFVSSEIESASYVLVGMGVLKQFRSKRSDFGGGNTRDVKLRHMMAEPIGFVN